MANGIITEKIAGFLINKSRTLEVKLYEVLSDEFLNKFLDEFEKSKIHLPNCIGPGNFVANCYTEFVKHYDEIKNYVKDNKSNKKQGDYEKRLLSRNYEQILFDSFKRLNLATQKAGEYRKAQTMREDDLLEAKVQQ